MASTVPKGRRHLAASLGWRSQASSIQEAPKVRRQTTHHPPPPSPKTISPLALPLRQAPIYGLSNRKDPEFGHAYLTESQKKHPRLRLSSTVPKGCTRMASTVPKGRRHLAASLGWRSQAPSTQKAPKVRRQTTHHPPPPHRKRFPPRTLPARHPLTQASGNLKCGPRPLYSKTSPFKFRNENNPPSVIGRPHAPFFRFSPNHSRLA